MGPKDDTLSDPTLHGTLWSVMRVLRSRIRVVVLGVSRNRSSIPIKQYICCGLETTSTRGRRPRLQPNGRDGKYSNCQEKPSHLTGRDPWSKGPIFTTVLSNPITAIMKHSAAYIISVNERVTL